MIGSSPRTPHSAIASRAALLCSGINRRSTASVTPPVTPKRTPPPEPKPNGTSLDSGSRAAKSIPELLIIRISSVVVITKSVSCSPFVKLFGRLISIFFAVHGMNDTITVRLPSECFGSLYHSFVTADIMPCGERQVERFGLNSGYWSQTNFTHAGQQEVRSGNFLPDCTLFKNSADSSITVRSALNVVSYTSSKPMR